MNTKPKHFEAGWLLVAVLVAALLMCGVAAAYFVVPGVAQPQIGKGGVTINLSGNGKVQISWPAAPNGALSRVTVRTEDEKEFRLLNEYSDHTAVVDSGILDQPFVLRIQSAVYGKNLLGMNRRVLSAGSIEITVDPPKFMQPELTSIIDQPGELRLEWNGAGSYELCAVDGRDHTTLGTVEGNSISLSIGKGGDVELPSYDQPLELTIRAICRGEGYVLYGPYVQPVEVARSELLGNELSLECQEIDSRNYILRWNETQAESYEVQEWSYASKRWSTIATIPQSEPPCYDTGTLRSGTNHRYQVVAVGGGAIAPEEVSLRAGISTLYATIWPLVDLKLYADAAMVKTLATIPAGTALCVLEEDGDCFQVRYKDRYGYVDSRYCMINLPEYTGDFCAYSIANSEKSLFTVHDNPIAQVTGEVIPGFEGVNTAEDGYLVPYLYPSAKKLLTAAQAAERDGYRLRIYEAFRPNEATRYLYDTTLAQLDYPLPELDGQGNYVFYVPPEPDPDEAAGAEEGGASATEPEPDAGAGPEGGAPAGEGEDQTLSVQTLSSYVPDEGEPPPPVLPEEDVPEPEPETPAVSDRPASSSRPSNPQPQQPAQPDPVEDPVQSEPVKPKGPTYRQTMTDGQFDLSSFLAPSVSNHNRGVALDVTLEKLDGTKLEMQSLIHDLSRYSAVSRNNDNAKRLESYMTMAGVGMEGTPGMWWHFEDDATRSALGLSGYLFKGVTAEGWTRDKTGWRYRYADGQYARGLSIHVDGKRYVMDANGYAVENE